MNLSQQMPPDDFELLVRWRSGDRQAGAELTSRHLASLTRFFASKLDVGVSDLVQTTLLQCVEARDRFEGRASFRTWLFVVARNVLHDRLRRQWRVRGGVDLSAVSLVDLATSPSRLVARDQRHAALIDALRSLPIDFQIAIELTYWEGLNATEVGEVLGVPASTVRTRLTRARRRLSRDLGPL